MIVRFVMAHPAGISLPRRGSSLRFPLVDAACARPEGPVEGELDTNQCAPVVSFGRIDPNPKQEDKMPSRGRMTITAGLLACAALFGIPSASAEDAPRSYVASPDVYKVIAESGNTKMILATWPPGHRDKWHSHPPTAVYRLTDCESRVYTPDGNSRDNNTKAGSAVVQAAISSHSFENRGNAECRAVIVEHE